MCFQQAIPLQNMKDSSKRCTIHFSKLLCLPNDMVSPALEGQKQRSCSVTFVLVTNIIIASLWFHKVWARLSMRSSRPALIILLLLSITCVMFVVLTICGHRHVRLHFVRSMYRRVTSYKYEQTQWLRNTLLVKRRSCLLSQSGSVGRHAAMTSKEKDSADTQKAVCENMPLPFPATILSHCLRLAFVINESVIIPWGLRSFAQEHPPREQFLLNPLINPPATAQLLGLDLLSALGVEQRWWDRKKRKTSQKITWHHDASICQIFQCKYFSMAWPASSHVGPLVEALDGQMHSEQQVSELT